MRYFTSYLKKVILFNVTRVTCNALPPTLQMVTLSSVLLSLYNSVFLYQSKNILNNMSWFIGF